MHGGKKKWTGERVRFASRVSLIGLSSTWAEQLSTFWPHLAVRVRPFSEREAALIAPDKTSQAFHGDGSLGATPTHQNLLNAHRSSNVALRRIVRTLDDRVLVFDPPETNPVTSYQRQILGASAKKVKDIRFCFDRVFEESATQEDVYRGSASDLVGSVLQGFNATVFAYGARRPRCDCTYRC
jgi:kinesin family member 18/19